MLSTDQTLNKGRYRIINLFSHDDTGGMYEAYDTVSNSNVVLKECVNALGSLATSDQIQELDAAFAASAKVLTSIKHDSLVSVQDYFSEIGAQYLVLDGVTGLDLTKYLDPDEPRPTLSDVMSWTNKLLAGLHYLHRLSPPFIHRDIRPKNIKLTSADAVKLLTAGIGMDATVGNVPKVSVRSSGQNARNYRPLEQLLADADQTEKEAVLKGFDEKAQKQVLEPLDTRGDLYSAGASIYHILTGTLPPDAVSRALAVNEGKPDPLKAPMEIDENIPEDISKAFLKALSIQKEDRFESAVIMNQVLRTAVVRTQERTKDGAEVPIQLKPLPRNAAPKPAPVLEPPVARAPVIEPVAPEAPKPGPIIEVDAEPPAEVHKQEPTSLDSLLELERKKTEELEAERVRLEEEQKRIEARRIELEAERERSAGEKHRLELEAKQERERLEKERLEKEAEEERQRAAKKMAELEAERQKRQAEEKRLEKLAEEEKKKAEERLKALRSEHERIREERRRIEEAEKEELERTEQRLLELSVQPNSETGEIPGHHEDEQVLEVHSSDPGVKTTQEIIELLEDELLVVEPVKTKASSKDRITPYHEDDDFTLHEERRSGLPMPVMAAAGALLLLVAVGAWMFMSSSSPATPQTTAVPPPVEQPVVGPQQTDLQTLATGNVDDPANAPVTITADSGDSNTDQRSAFAEEQDRKVRQARLDAAKKPVATPSKTPKKVTVDDLINDN